jgi:N-acetylmuramoyl-L-alanine amidase
LRGEHKYQSKEVFVVYKICIDPGHGGKDPGAVNGSKYEKVATLAIAKKVGKKLQAKGYEVKYTRSTDKYVSLAERCKISNNFGADAFISIHLNSVANRSASGIETWRFPSVDKQTVELAENVQRELISAIGWKDRKVKKSSTLYVLKKTIASAILVECGFLSHLSESIMLFQNKYQEKIADSIVVGIEKTLKK